MKPRRIPAKAERVYTYRLDRLPKKNTGNEEPDNNGTSGNRNFESRNDVNTGRTTPPARRKTEETGKPKPESQPKKKRLYSWGAPEDSGKSFYDEMLDHETGDPTPEERTIASKPHLTHTGEVPQLAKTDYLNTDVDGTLVQDEKDGPGDKGLQGELPSPFLEGDVSTHYFPHDKA